MTTICFVTDEVMPFTMGGIGAFIRNTLDYYSENDKISILYTGAKTITKTDWKERFDKVEFFSLQDFTGVRREKWERTSFEHPFMKRSMIIKEYLSDLNRTMKFDYIEFVDWGGLSFYTQQTKLACLDFANTKICVRIHTTDGILRRFEGRNPGYHTALLTDFERKSLADADIVVAHLETVSKYVADFYGFDSRWKKRVRIATPPVQVSMRAKATIDIDPKQTNIVFTSKLQDIKRPEVFIRGASLFIEKCEEYEAKIILTAMEPVSGWSSRMRSLIPSEYLNRFDFASDLTQKSRSDIIARSVAVFPNAYEAFCFAAYEASLAGAVCVVNENNIAFGPDTPWVHGVNCFKFDGSSIGLAKQLEQIFFNTPCSLRPIDRQADVHPYWRDVFPSKHRGAFQHSCAAIILIEDSRMANLQTIFNLLSREESFSEVVVAVKSNLDFDNSIVLSKLSEISRCNSELKIIKYKSNLTRGSLLNCAIDSLRSDFFVYCPGGTLTMPGFVDAACAALAENALFDTVLPISNVVGDDSDFHDNPIFTFFPVGEGISTNMIQNRIAAHAFVGRTAIFKLHRFNEDIESQQEWELLTRMSISGIKMICWPDITIGYPEHIAASLAPSSDIAGRSTTHRVRENLIWSCRGGAGSFSILNDLAEIVYVPTPPTLANEVALDARDVEPIASPAPQTDEKAAHGLDIEQLTAIYDKSVENFRRGYRKRIFNITRPAPQKLYVHLDFFNNTDGELDFFNIEIGHDLSLVGWWRTDNPIYGSHNFRLLAKMNGNFLDFNASNHKRIDVAVTHQLPTSMNLGFSAQLENSLLSKGEYLICGQLYVEGRFLAESEICRVVVK